MIGIRVKVSAQGIFGLQVNNTKQPLPTSEITASSQLGIDGTININTPDFDPSRGLAELPSNFTDPSNQIVAGCPADKGNNFVVTGRGGIPDNPSQYLQERAVWQDTRNLPAVERTEPPTPNTPNPTSQTRLIEAQGWIVAEDGTVILTAQRYQGQVAGFLNSSPSCQRITN